MECTINKPGASCQFMTQRGCTFMGGACFSMVEQCEGCTRIETYETGRYCTVYPNPTIKWRNGTCNLATHAKSEVQTDATAKKVNPLKAAKRGSRQK